MASTQRYKELRLGQLRAFCACVRHGSFSAAARALDMSQPAVWQQVRALETDLGVELLRRQRRNLVPTEDGRLLLEMAADILGSVDALTEAFAERRGNLPRPLVVIGSPGVIAEELAQPVVAFCRRYPHIQLTLLSYAGLRSLDLLLTGEADVAVLPLASEAAGHGSFLVAEPLCERRWVVVAPEGHPLTRKRRPTLADVTRYPLILPEKESNWRKRLDDVLRSVGLQDSLRVLLEVNLTLAARRYVSLGLGIALLPQPQMAFELPRLVTRTCVDLPTTEAIVLLWRRGSKPRPQARLFADCVRRDLATGGPAPH